MQLITKSIAALGIVGAVAMTVPAPAQAQGVYIEGPGFGVGVGRPVYRDYRYRDYYGPYVYTYERPYRHYRSEWSDRRGRRDRDWDD